MARKCSIYSFITKRADVCFGLLILISVVMMTRLQIHLNWTEKTSARTGTGSTEPSSKFVSKDIQSFRYISNVSSVTDIAKALLKEHGMKTENEEEEEEGDRSLSDTSPTFEPGQKFLGPGDFDDGVWPRPYEPRPRPPLDSIVRGWNITSDPQWLLNFAITGFPKCGTSTMMHFLSNNETVREVQIFARERCELSGSQQVPLIRSLYNDLPSGDYVRGIKCPRDLESDVVSLRNYGRFFPKTDFIVGIRHPVKWFESFYNHRIHNRYDLLPAHRLPPTCTVHSKGVCTDRANFHLALVWLGKTPASRDEMALFFPRRMHSRNFSDLVRWRGRVFLYEVDQLNDRDNAARSRRFRDDLQRFLYLRNPLPPMVWFRPGRKAYSDEVLRTVEGRKMNICEGQYAALRRTLIQIGTNASLWIRRYFLSNPDVVVSSRSYFEEILEGWLHDPCDDGGTYKQDIARMNCTKRGCFLIANDTATRRRR